MAGTWVSKRHWAQTTDWPFFRLLEEANLPGRPKSAAPCFCSGRALQRYAARHGIDIRQAMAELLAHDIWPERFRRQQGLLSPDAQIRLLTLPVFIAGCGGLGGEIAAKLVRLGAGRIRLCDYDIFEESNLNRQRFCVEASLGQEKAKVTAHALQEMASWGDYEPCICKITPDNIAELISDCEIVIDCLDSVAGKKMLEQAAAGAGKAFLHGSVLHQEGFAFLSHPASGALSRLYSVECTASGAGSVFGHVVAGTASLMCSLFVNWLSGRTRISPLLHCDFSAPVLSPYELP